MSPPKTPSRLRPVAPSREEKQASQEGRKAGRKSVCLPAFLPSCEEKDGARKDAKPQRTINTQAEIDQLPLLDLTKPIYVAGTLVVIQEVHPDGGFYANNWGYNANGSLTFYELEGAPASNYPEAMCAADVIRLHAAATSALPAFLPSYEATRPGDMAQTSECDADLANLATWEKFGMILMIGISGTISGWVLFSLGQWVVRLAHKTGFPL